MTFVAAAAWLRPRLWVGMVVGMVPWAVWVGSLALGGWYKDASGKLIGADHLAFYSAAHLIRDGEPARMYEYSYLNRYQLELIGWEWRGFEAYRNPPFYALLYLPTAYLSFYASFVVWMCLSFVLLALGIRLLRPQRPLQVLFWSLSFYPLFATISFGQNTCLSLVVFAGVYRLLESDRRFSAGFVCGLLFFKPQLLLGLIIWWAFSPRKYARSFLGLLAMGAVLGGLSWGLLSSASWAFTNNLPTIVGFRGFGMWNVHTPRAFFELLLPEWPQMSGLLALGVSLLSIAIAAWLSRRSGGAIAVMFPVAIFLSLWASPHALVYEWALLIPACVVLWERFPSLRDRWVCLFALAWFALAVGTPLAYIQFAYLHTEHVLQMSVPILGMVGWLAARQLLREGKGGT